jgi:hypothetical protein
MAAIPAMLAVMRSGWTLDNALIGTKTTMSAMA